MPRVQPFHSIEAFGISGVYHAHSGCQRGWAIDSWNRADGTGGGRLCWWCRRRIAEDKEEVLARLRRDIRKSLGNRAVEMAELCALDVGAATDGSADEFLRQAEGIALSEIKRFGGFAYSMFRIDRQN